LFRSIFICENGSSVKIGKLNLAAQFDESEAISNETPALSGIENYMSPELISNEKWSYATDVWSSGCVLYEMIMLRKAFDSKQRTQLVESIMSKEIIFDKEANFILQTLVEQ
jgi:serine/threonine protein kinase